METNSLSGRKTKGISVAQIVWIIGISLLFLLTTINPVLSFSLDSMGKGAVPCSYNQCSLTSAAVKVNTTNKISYEFKGTCSTTQEGCKNTNMIATAEWNRITRVASEVISKDIGVTTVGLVNTQSNCSDNPWINKNATCSLASSPPLTMPGPFPKTALLISDAQRQSFMQQDKLFLSTPQAPVVLSPIANHTYTPSAAIQIKVQHNPNYGVGFEFQWCPFNKPNTPPGFFITKNLMPVNLKTNAGMTTADLTINEVGKWRLKTQSNFPNAPWSGWTDFVVDTLKMTPGLQPGNKPGK